MNNKINKIQKGALRIVYNDVNSTNEELLAKDGLVTIHERNLLLRCKVIGGYSPQIMKDVFQLINKRI